MRLGKNFTAATTYYNKTH